MDIHTLQQQLDLIIQHAPAINREYAEAKATYESLNNLHKPNLARCKTLVIGKSEAEKEKYAMRHPEYLEFLEGLNQANKEYLLAYGKKSSLETKLSALQSLSKLYQNNL